VQILLARAMLAILAGTALGALQYFCAVRGRSRLLAAIVPGHIAVWTYLLFLAHEPRSPLFVGYLLEQVLSAVLLSRGGALLATGCGIVAYAGYASASGPALDLAAHIAILGALAVSGMLTSFLVTVLERQNRTLADLQHALQLRAADLTEELRLLGDYLAGGLLTLDDLGRVDSVNRAGAELLALDPADAIGHPWQEVLHPDPTSAKRIAYTVSEGAPQRSVPLLLDRGRDGFLCASAQVWSGPSGDGPRTYIYITPTMPPMQAGDPLQKLGLAAACVAHQIKNSLHALQGYLGRVREGRGDAAGTNLESFDAALHSLGELAEDVLMQSGRSRPTHAVHGWVSALDLVQAAVALARPAAGVVDVDVRDESLLVYGSRAQLAHALFNLLDNALGASHGTSAVRIVARSDHDEVAISVLDDGPGIPAHFIDRADPVPSGHGSGLGLLTARRYVEANGGNLHVATRRTGGTTCTIRLPRHPPGAPASPAVAHQEVS
jgi:nitrogen fixation/metabolism regulation signal transduction histidine kinase